MLLRKIFFVGIALLLATGAYADIGQLEGYKIDAINIVLVDGFGVAQGANLATVGHSQQAFDPSTGTIAIQGETGTLIQVGIAIATGGTSGVGQGADAGAIQEQLVINPQLQGQAIGAKLGQGAVSEGPAAGAGSQGFVGGQIQHIASPDGVSSEAQFVAATQVVGVATGPCSVAAAANALDVHADQIQFNN